MKSWKQVVIPPEMPVLEAIRIIDTGALQIALVVDSDMKLLGVATDGDVRRGILRGIRLEDPVEHIMSRDFSFARKDSGRESILSLMRQKELRHIPILDEQGRIVDLCLLMDMVAPAERKNSVVLMAGGLGSRLRPLTNDCPKPLLKVGGKPLLENIIESFAGYGFKRFFISVNYMAEMIKDYFEDGAKLGVSISYLWEHKRLGTAGALSQLTAHPEESFFVMNGDLLTQINFDHLLDFHLQHKAQATMCVREYHYQVPYGVVRAEGEILSGIDEKPVQTFFVNAGIYVLEPMVLRFIPENSFFDMPTLFEKLIEKGHKTTIFPIREYWLDIGQMDDLKRANRDYCNNFLPEGEPHE